MAVGKQLKLPTLKYRLTADQKLFFQKYGPVVAKLRRDPVFVARFLHGIIVPPHQRVMLRGIWQEFREYHFLAGRGTSKSATVASMAPSIRAETYSRRKFLSLSASKFRGGKTIMEEAADFMFGRFKDQRPIAPFTRETLKHKAGVKREGDRWTMPFTTHSFLGTIPTGNLESARGLRANWLVLDEADNWENSVIRKYFEPFLAVGTSFERTGEDSSSNIIFHTGTASYIHTDWARTLIDRERMIQRRFEAQKSLEAGDYDNYFRLMNEEDGRLWNFSVVFQRWDYTDLIIPLEFDDFEVYYPAIDRSTGQVEVNPDWLIKWDRRDKVHYIYTYPFAKDKIEDALDDGQTDFDTWAAENRCQFIKSGGNVFSSALLERATETELLSASEAEKKGWDLEERGVYYPQLMWECKAPCVLGVDPARTSDFAAFVVIRLGELEDPNKPYNPLTGEGYTPYNNVIWAEAHRRLTIRDVCNKIYELKERYNLVVSTNPEQAYGIGIDARGAMAGATVRDELARPTPDVDEHGNVDPNWVQPQIIYDPLDQEYRHLAMRNDAWPGLRLLWTSDALNTEWVSYAKGQFEQQKLYIAKYLSPSERYDPEDKLNAGYLGVQSLKHQLMRVEGRPTKYHMQYVIPGDAKRIENKDDLFKAFLYAVSAMRAHLTIQTKKNKTPPTPAAILVRPKRVRLF